MHQYIQSISLEIRPLHLNHLDSLTQFKNYLLFVSFKKKILRN